MVAPPKTYEEWLRCLDRLKEKWSDIEVIQAVRDGALTVEGLPFERFQHCIAETFNAMIQDRMSLFDRQLNHMLEMDDLEFAVDLMRRLKKDLRSLAFFQDLDFLPGSFREQLCMEAERQLGKYFERIMDELACHASENHDESLHIAVAGLRRITRQPLFGARSVVA